MVGSRAAADRSKEAVGMLALHEALRSVCLNSDWTYSVFWTIRPRPRIRGGDACKVGDDNGCFMLMWEDGFCRGKAGECMDETDSKDPVRKAFSKMSIQLYNYGEGLMGKVASDKCHKWVFKEPSECEPNISNYWQSSFDALPPEWIDQFESGIQTIAVIQAGHGLLQLGSCKIIPEDLHFVLRMRHTFESLGYQSGFYVSQLFSSNRSSSSSSCPTVKQSVPPFPPPPLFNWGQRPQASASASMLASPNYQRTSLGFPSVKDGTRMFLIPHSAEARMQEMTGEPESDVKWPNGLSFFNALTGRDEGGRLLFNPEILGNKLDQSQEHALMLEGKHQNPNPDLETSNLHGTSRTANPNEFLNHNSMRKMENKFKRSFTLPARMVSSSSSTSITQHHTQHPAEYRNGEPGIYPDLMGPLE